MILNYVLVGILIIGILSAFGSAVIAIWARLTGRCINCYDPAHSVEKCPHLHW